jgi:regulator of PEP synthase PpsR (kinase-PPPase family)
VNDLKAQGWIVVDSTEQSVEETVATILEQTGNSLIIAAKLY